MVVVNEKIAFSPAEVAQVLGISLNNVYALVREGAIPSLRLGRRILIPRKELDLLMQFEKANEGG